MSEKFLLKKQKNISQINMVINIVLVFIMIFVYFQFKSQLALAQSVDSFLDIFTTCIFIYTLTISTKPHDHNHHFGHGRAEPIAALIVAIVAVFLAFEVFQSAIKVIFLKDYVILDKFLLIAFIFKTLIKGLFFIISSRFLRKKHSPVIQALMLDSQNDILLNIIAIISFFMADFIYGIDAFLAIPVSFWIAYSGFNLAKDNIKLIMGEAPSIERQKELLLLAKNVEGVINAHDLRAQHIGIQLEIHIHIVVNSDISVLKAHDIGELVRSHLEQEDDVAYCAVHIDIKE